MTRMTVSTGQTDVIVDSAFDAANRRVKKATGTGSLTHYVWEGSQIIAEYNGTTGALIYEYVYAGGRMVARDQGGTLRYFHQDRLSTRMLTDGTGVVKSTMHHEPFGEEGGTTGPPEKHRFTSYERDESNTDYAMNRQYETANGRFMRPDPVPGSLVDPQSWNRYAYTANDPVNLIDPEGLLIISPFIIQAIYNWFTSAWLSFSVNVQADYSIEPWGWGGGGGGGGSSLGGGIIDLGGGIDAEAPPCPPVPDHPASADINKNIDEAEAHGAASIFNPVKGAVDVKNVNWFYNQVRNKGPWDYKQQGRQYQDFGNFNYGATGLATALFGETTLLQEAGRGQVKAGTSKPEWGYPPSLLHPFGKPPYGDDPADQEQIQKGFAYYYARKKGCQQGTK